MRLFRACSIVVSALSVGAATAPAQDFHVVAELGRAGPRGAASVLPLATGGPAFLVSVSRTMVNVWPTGRVAEPIVSPLPPVDDLLPQCAFADFDGDGRLDIAVVSGASVVLLSGDGAGRFAPAGVLPVPPGSLVPGDFDGDGRIDLAVVERTPGASVIACYLSTGRLTFAAARTTPVTIDGGIGSVAVGDVDGDSRGDLVVGNGSRGGPTVWKSNGDGTFTLLPQQLAGVDTGPVSIVDLDGDGRPELVYENVMPMLFLVDVYVYKNDGGGTFHLWATFTKTRSSSSPIVRDVDGDGRPDVSFVDLDASLRTASFVSYGFSGGAWVESRVPGPLQAADTFGGDWDGDGRTDLFVTTPTGVVVFGRSGARTDVVAVPVLLATTGLLGSRFDSDLLLTNSGATSAHVVLRYVATEGGGSGVVETDLAAGRQLFAPSAVAFLRDAGLAIAAGGNVVGTLRVEATGASSPRAVSAAVRTTSPSGAGVAYAGTPGLELLRGSAIVPWLAETARDRTNLALVNAGAPADGPVTLRIEVHAGDPSLPSAILPDVVLAPGGFTQIGRVLAAAGLETPVGWARITRVDGNAPYLAWAAVNDAGTGDGSFEAAMSEDAATGGPWIVPSAVQTGRYSTELVATNPDTRPLDAEITFVATGAVLRATIAPGGTLDIPDLFAEARQRGLPGAPAADADFVSPLTLKAGGARLYAGIRVSSSPSAGKSFGVFEPARVAAASGIVPDLRQGAGVRTNLGVVNVSPFAQRFRVEVVNGETSGVTGSTELALDGNGFRQINAVLPGLASGTSRAFARITLLAGPPGTPPGPFAAYAVVNDGATPGAGTDDGSFVSGVPE